MYSVSTSSTIPVCFGSVSCRFVRLLWLRKRRSLDVEDMKGRPGPRTSRDPGGTDMDTRSLTFLSFRVPLTLLDDRKG